MKKLALLLGITVLAACSTTQTPPVSPSQVTLETIEQMTPEQIRGLSDEQADAVFSEAESVLKLSTSAVDDLAPLDSRWPNYGYTLSVATGMTYETYLSSYYKKYSGPNWTDDGCSGPTPPVIFDNNACRQHDFGYRNVSQYRQGRNENVRKSIDTRFLSNMRLKCDRYWNHWWEYPLRQACKVDALVFYGAVRNFGSSSFYGTTARYP